MDSWVHCEDHEVDHTIEFEGDIWKKFLKMICVIIELIFISFLLHESCLQTVCLIDLSTKSHIT